MNKFQSFRLRDAPVLRTLHEFGKIYEKGIEHRIAQTKEQLQRAIGLITAKGNEVRQNNNDAFERAKKLSEEAQKKSEIYWKEHRK